MKATVLPGLHVVVTVLLIVQAPWAAAAGARSPRARIPEPLLLDSTTDIDSDETGEVEIDLVGTSGRHGSGATVEAEWRATRQLGLSLQVGTTREPGGEDLDASAAVAWALYHQYALDLHVQAFGRVRLPFTAERQTAALDPADPVLPISAGVQGAIRRGLVTVRSELAVEAGGNGAHRLSVRGATALLMGGSLGFAGVELLGDLASSAPWTLAAEASLDISRGLLPLRLGVAVPWRLQSPHDVAVIAGVVVELN